MRSSQGVKDSKGEGSENSSVSGSMVKTESNIHSTGTGTKQD